MDNCNFQRTYNQAFLYAMGETNRSGQSKKRALTFTDFYDVVLVAITDEDGNELGHWKFMAVTLIVIATPEQRNSTVSTRQSTSVPSLGHNDFEIYKIRIIERHRLHQKQAGIVSEMGISTSTVNYMIKDFKKTGTAKRQNGSGRPHLFTERFKSLLRKIVKANKGALLEFIQSRLPFEASTWTITHELKLTGVHKRVVAKKPFLSEQHRKARFRLAKDHKDWSLEQWRKVIWRELWEKIPYRRKTGLMIIPKKKRSSADFVKNVYEPALLNFYNSVDNATLMEDNAPIPIAPAAKEWRDAHSVVKLQRPAQSSDLNPIENLWMNLKRQLNREWYESRSSELNLVLLKRVWNRI
ncbi:hypothetical protein G6F56_006191 [Rhizopus delemar]|nr:hypothetical protein G6F56_006191 [Rhizopus delemar]